MMLRPDFTLPVVQAHMAHGADPARYTYLGEVFRKQDHPGTRASEYLQVGFEVFDRSAPEAADAEVFALFATLLAPLNLTRRHGRYRHPDGRRARAEHHRPAQSGAAAPCLAAPAVSRSAGPVFRPDGRSPTRAKPCWTV